MRSSSRRVHLTQPRGERAVQLVERHPRLQRRHRVDQVADRLRLDEIDPSVQKRAERELARIRQSRAGRDGGGDDRVEDHRTAVGATTR